MDDRKPWSFKTGLDLTAPDSFDAEEADRLVTWYATTHGEGDLGLVPFVPFALENLPSALKRYRAYVEEMYAEPRSDVVGLLAILYHYIRIGNGSGIVYEVIACRRAGLTKRQVLDAIEHAFLDCGPFGLNAVATAAAEYLARWDAAEDEEDPLIWPEGWEVGGVGTDTRLDASIPAFLARERPRAADALRARHAHLEGARLPRPAFPTMHLVHEIVGGDAAGVRYYTERALRAGASPGQLVDVAALAVLYTDVAALGVAGAALEETLLDAPMPSTDT
jgi:alkylhydroperoxidase/carboxymuconolactone decarboxylase family protein YurZ